MLEYCYYGIFKTIHTRTRENNNNDNGNNNDNNNKSEWSLLLRNIIEIEENLQTDHKL